MRVFWGGFFCCLLVYLNTSLLTFFCYKIDMPIAVIPCIYKMEQTSCNVQGSSKIPVNILLLSQPGELNHRKALTSPLHSWFVQNKAQSFFLLYRWKVLYLHMNVYRKALLTVLEGDLKAYQSSGYFITLLRTTFK